MTFNERVRNRHNQRTRAQYERRKAQHLPAIKAMVKDHTLAQMAEATRTSTGFVQRVIKEEGLR